MPVCKRSSYVQRPRAAAHPNTLACLPSTIGIVLLSFKVDACYIALGRRLGAARFWTEGPSERLGSGAPLGLAFTGTHVHDFRSHFTEGCDADAATKGTYLHLLRWFLITVFRFLSGLPPHRVGAQETR